jgi:hypothetical protein
MRYFATARWKPPLVPRSLVNIDHCKDQVISEANRVEVGNRVAFVP